MAIATLGGPLQPVHEAGTAWKIGDLASFSGKNGAAPSGLAGDFSGNLYGATAFGGAFDEGTVYRLSPPPAGKTTWTLTVLASFGGEHGSSPFGTLTLGSGGILYGAAPTGGAAGFGVIYQLIPPAPGATAWKENVLTLFSGKNGNYPKGGLILDNAGNLFGTTSRGGAFGYGEVFELSPPPQGKALWQLTVLYSFNPAAGISPNGDLVRDPAGNLFGTTTSGGRFGDGTVFELQPGAAGGWRALTLFSFNGRNGSQPIGGLALGTEGSLYGTTFIGGLYAAGTVFRLTPPQGGKTAWTETILRSFLGNNGANPMSTPLLDALGNIYGTTEAGGAGGTGTVFRLSPPSAGKTAWGLSVLATFQGSNGANPQGALIADQLGNLYGTSLGGGKNVQGTVFRLTPLPGNND